MPVSPNFLSHGLVDWNGLKCEKLTNDEDDDRGKVMIIAHMILSQVHSLYVIMKQNTYETPVKIKH